MRLLEGDEFVRGILEPAGLCLADVERTRRAGTSYRTLSVPAPVPSPTTPLKCAIPLQVPFTSQHLVVLQRSLPLLFDYGTLQTHQEVPRC